MLRKESCAIMKNMPILISCQSMHKYYQFSRFRVGPVECSIYSMVVWSLKLNLLFHLVSVIKHALQSSISFATLSSIRLWEIWIEESDSKLTQSERSSIQLRLLLHTHASKTIPLLDTRVGSGMKKPYHTHKRNNKKIPTILGFSISTLYKDYAE